MVSENGSFGKKFDNDGLVKPSLLAIAIENRQIKEEEKESCSINWLLGLPQSEMNKKVRFAHGSLETEIIMRNPLIGSHREIISKTFDNISEEECLLSMHLGPSTDPRINKFMTPKKAKEFRKRLYMYTNKKDPFPDQRKDLMKQVTEAKKMGKEKRCATDLIFSNNAYYEELIRRTSSPQKTITDGIAELNRLSVDKLEEECMQGVVILYEVALEDTSIDQIEKEKAVRLAAMNVKYSTNLGRMRKRFPEYKQAKARYLIEKVDRFWGEGTFDRLPEEIRAKVNGFIDLASTP
jgi:hypothetical protein